MSNIIKWILVIAGLLFFILLFLNGCHLFSQGKLEPLEERLPKLEIKEVIIEKIKTEYMYKNLGLIQGMLIIGATGGLIVCFLKLPAIGIPIFLGCTGGLGLVAARLYYGALMGIVALVAAVLAVVYAIWINRKAFTQVIAGGEHFKEANPESKVAFVNCQSVEQIDKSTRKLVAKTRKKLNGKETNERT
jgi:hypothetical protein